MFGAGRSLPRAIVHLDADAFFASVEQASDPRLRGKPIAVGGEKRGIIASASYEARKFGIYTPMPTTLARRLCPKLILLPGDFEKYELFSRLMFSYAYDFTPDVEIGSIDEGYFDLTGASKPAASIAETVRLAIRQSLKLSVSEGIATNKLVSQIASKLRKPSAFELVPPGQEAEYLAPLPSQWLPGIGPKAAAQFNAAGLARIGQIARTPLELLGLLAGSRAPQLKNFALGIDPRPVVPARAPAQSYGEQETFAADTTDEAFVEATLRRMADTLMAKVRQEHKSIRTLTVKVRYNDMDEQQASESLPEPTDLETDLYGKISFLLRKAWQRRVSLRLVSLRLSNVYSGCCFGGLALDGAALRRAAQQRLAEGVDALRQKYGRTVLLRGHDFVLRDRNGGETKPRKVRLRPGFARRGLEAGGRNAKAEAQELKSEGRPAASRGGGSPALPRKSPACVPLNVHSYYSFLDSTLSIQAIVDLARRHELPALALTDRYNLHGAVEFAREAAQAGIKPIIGAELEWGGQRLCLYVENQTGYRHLCRILTVLGASGGTNREPLFQDTGGLVAVSPSAGLAPLFPGRFYLEIRSPEACQQRPAHLPCVASLPVHYELPSDRWKYNLVQSIRTLTLLRQEHPAKRLTGAYHFRADAEMRRLFQSAPDLLAHSVEIADRCSFQFTFGKPQFPSYTPPDGSSPGAFLRRLALEGLRRRYANDYERRKTQVEEELAIITEVGYEEYFLVMWDILQECRRRGIEWITRGSAADSLICYCLGISNVCPIRFDLYFRRFLNRDRMALNKLPDIDVDFPHDRKDDVIDLVFEKYGPGHTALVGGFSTFQARSAFAEVAKVLGVSEFQVRRITERFPYYTRSSELAEAMAHTPECRDLPLAEEPCATALRMARFLDGFPRYAKMHPCGLVLSRQPMDHIAPCFVSAKGYPATHFDMDAVEAVGLVKMDILAQGGLAVMRDVKALLERRERNAAEQPDPKPPAPAATIEPPASKPRISGFPDALAPWDDPQVWELIASGNARAVHHIESPAMISLCRMCNVRDIDTLIAIVSVIRPGAANESKKLEFARRYQGLSPVRYPHPALESCLRSTYGLVVYEEHILQICEAFAHLPPGRADVLRRALAKDKTEVIARIQTEFTECARRHGRTEEEIAAVWALVAGFRGYAFCKAHSTAYGVEAYQSAWLKRYYPVEFMAAVLTNGKGFYSPLVYILECHRLGIPLLPPSVNEPGPQFTVTHGKIRVPLLRLKGLTRRTADRLLAERERAAFSSLADFFLRVQPLPEEMDLLIRAGAFDPFGQPRTSQYWEFKALCRSGHPPARPSPSSLHHGNNLSIPNEQEGSRFGLPFAPSTQISTSLPRPGVQCPQPSPSSSPPPTPPSATSRAATQLWLLPPGNLDRLPDVPLAEPDRLARLRAEEELLGYPVSGHPLELFPDIAWNTYCPINRLGDYLGQEVVTCGLVIEQRLFHQVTGEPMKFLTIADWTGMIETELFARTYQSCGLNTVRYRVLEITATVEPFENHRGHTLRVLRAGKPRTIR